MLESWKTKAKERAPKCETALNIVASHCIRRNLFLKCPVKETSQQCQNFFEFAKKCKAFPMMRKKKEEKN